MKYRSIFSALSLSIFVPFVSAMEIQTPKPYGELSMGGLKEEGSDFSGNAFKIHLGVHGKASVSETLDLNYLVEVDLTSAANNRDPGGEADVHIKEARFWLPTKYGLFVAAARGVGGQWTEIYGPISHYEYNKPHEAPMPDGIFAQPERSSGTFAYHTPWVYGTKLVVAAITLDGDNGKDVDGRSVRVVHRSGELSMALGTTQVVQEQLPAFATEDYLISAAGIGYSIGGLSLGAVWENNRNSPYPLDPQGKADFDSYGVSAQYITEGGAGIALGYKEKDHDYSAADNSVYTVKLEQRITPQVKVWAETGQYDKPVVSPQGALVTDTNYAIGFNLTF